MLLKYSHQLKRDTYFLNSKTGGLEYTLEKCREAMISKEHTEAVIREFTEFHVKQALEAANKNLCVDVDDNSGLYIHEDTILNAYPLQNIK